MNRQILQLIADHDDVGKVCDALEELPQDSLYRVGLDEGNDRQMLVISLYSVDMQEVQDAISDALEGRENWQLFVLPTEANLPVIEDEDAEERIARKRTANTREEIYADIRQGTALTLDYVILTALATLVAAIGLSSDEVAVVIGAMVIAPLLGPVLAMAFAVTLGNLPLLAVALRALGVGILVAMVVGLGLGFLIPGDHTGGMLDYSSSISLQTIALPLASGGAAALMVAGGQTSALVGVMVAAALLPPLAAFGLHLGVGSWGPALRALATVLANIVAINLAAQLVFRFKGIRPRRWKGGSHKTSVTLAFSLSAALVALVAGLFFAVERGWLF